MKIQDFSPNAPGQIIQTKKDYQAFIPNPLPPGLEWSAALISLLSEADRAVAKLAEIGRGSSMPAMLIKPFIHREAVSSSRIEGTRTTLRELYAYEARQLSFLEDEHDAQEVQNYIHALEYGLNRLDSFPVSLRLITELHEKLMQGVRGDFWTPGEFRRSQNWIGPPGSSLASATYVPPPVDEMKTCLFALEDFIHASSDLPPLIRLGLIHYQFEAIHPFLDGNGRIGRLLISLLLAEWGLLPQPWLHLSRFVELHRLEYYRLLLAVSQKGNWEEWLTFFLTGVQEQAQKAGIRIQSLIALRTTYLQKLESERNYDRLEKAVDFLFEKPVLGVRDLETGLALGNYMTAQRLVEKLEAHGILEEITGMSRNRVYRAEGILRRIDASVEELALLDQQKS